MKTGKKRRFSLLYLLCPEIAEKWTFGLITDGTTTGWEAYLRLLWMKQDNILSLTLVCGCSNLSARCRMALRASPLLQKLKENTIKIPETSFLRCLHFFRELVPFHWRLLRAPTVASCPRPRVLLHQAALEAAARVQPVWEAPCPTYWVLVWRFQSSLHNCISKTFPCNTRDLGMP